MLEFDVDMGYLLDDKDLGRMALFEVDMACLLEDGELDRVVLHDENGEHPPMLFEPPLETCRIESMYGFTSPFVGTGYCIELSCHIIYHWCESKPPAFCPYCGAKVVR